VDKTVSAQPVGADPMVPERPSTPASKTPPPQGKKEPDVHDPLHSEGIIRTLHDPATPQRTESQPVAPALAAQAGAKPKLPGGSYVQVGVFTHPANAAELKAKLEAQGIPVVIATRVQIGPFKSKKEAEAMREKLKAMGMTSIVISQ
jgi:cell division protein FtsN